MSDEDARPGDFNSLAQEMNRLEREIVADFTRVNADITYIVSKGGPFVSRAVSRNINNLMLTTRFNLHAQSEANLYLLDRYLSGYIGSINADDTATG